MSNKKLSAGDVIEAHCTRCRTLMNHTIVAMVGERVVRVQCNTCNGVHNYKEAKPAKVSTERSASPKPAAAPRASRKDPGAADRQEWIALRSNMQRERAKAYDMNGSYKVKDLVEHPVFGLGVVQRVVANKVEILFEQGRKLLRCQ
ncbi:MAG TPA: hypothetical protein VD811_04475 [Desulfuromonadales bacterium]|nr:hypothetical protein [Desulfuromonadales bacterium]